MLLTSLSLLMSCKSDDDNSPSETELIGDWKLIEVLSDPGDGSGTFTSVDSEKRISFKSDGTISSNGSLCDLSIDTNKETSGTFSLVDSTFTSSDCNNDAYNYSFEKNEDILIIAYPCIEACQVKYKKE